jgi:hypothetical protein
LLCSHYQVLGHYIIRNENENKEEINKISEFIKTMNKQNKNLISNVSIRRDEHDRPLRRPTTPMTNLSSTSNSQVFTNDRKSIASRIRANIPRNNTNSNVNDKEYVLKDQIETLEDRPSSKMVNRIEEEKVLKF